MKVNAKSQLFLLLMGYAIFSSENALSAPAPSAVISLDESAGTFTVSGSGFGNATPTSPQLWDTVDNQREFSDLPDDATVPTDYGPWTTNGNPWSNLMKLNRGDGQRTPTSRVNYYATAKGYLGWPRAFKGHTNESLYVSWYYKPSEHPNSGGGANKFIRMWDDPGGEHTRIAWTQVLLAEDWISWPGKVNEWNRMEIYFNNSNNTVTAWTNGEITGIVDGIKKMDYDSGMSIGLVGFDANYIENYQSMQFWLDDIYASPTIARLEVSDKSDWSMVDGSREIQPPLSWSNTEITARLNRGQFSGTSEQLFVYVIDANGEVNQKGIPLSQCLDCPEPPDLTISE